MVGRLRGRLQGFPGPAHFRNPHPLPPLPLPSRTPPSLTPPQTQTQTHPQTQSQSQSQTQTQSHHHGIDPPRMSGDVLLDPPAIALCLRRIATTDRGDTVWLLM